MADPVLVGVNEEEASGEDLFPETLTRKEMACRCPGLTSKHELVLLGERMYQLAGGVWWRLGNETDLSVRSAGS